MKFLVDRQTSKIRGPYRDSDLAGALVDGFMIYDVPDYIRDFNPPSDTKAALVTQKYAELQALHPSLTSLIYEEFDVFTGPVAGPPNSLKFTSGPARRMSLRPSGFGYFGTYVFPSAPTTLFARYMAYELSVAYGEFGSGGLSLDPSFDPALDLSFEITDTLGVVQQAVPSDVETLVTFAPAFPFNFLVKVTNTSSRNLTLSDFSLMWGLWYCNPNRLLISDAMHGAACAC